MKVLIYTCAFLVLLSCGSSRIISKGAVPERSKADIYSALINRNIDFQWLNAKMSTELDSPDEKVSGSMAVRIKKDSIIWIAIKKFGIEVARVLVDKEKYTVLYRIEGVYEVNPISKLNQLFSVATNFEDMQQLMFGNVILPDSSLMTVRKDSIYYLAEAKVDNLHMKYYINGYTQELDKISITDNMNRTAIASYADYRMVGNYGKVSFERTLIFPYSDQEDATINIKFSEIEINTPKEIKFSIPDSYEKIN